MRRSRDKVFTFIVALCSICAATPSPCAAPKLHLAHAVNAPFARQTSPSLLGDLSAPKNDEWQRLIAYPQAGIDARGPHEINRPAAALAVHTRRFVFVSKHAHPRVWLNLRASRLGQPGAMTASVHLKRRMYEGRLLLGVESLDQVVEPYAAEWSRERRTVRRVGPAISYNYHPRRRTAWRRLRPGTCIHVSGRLWPHRMGRGQGADLRAELSGLVGETRKHGLMAWGRARLRALLGAEDDHLALGGWLPELGKQSSRNAQPLIEPLLGYEDVQSHGHKLAQLTGGIGYAFSGKGRIELFAAASQIGSTQRSWELNVQDGATLRALGLALAKQIDIFGTQMTLAYQYAHRFDRSDAPALHLVSLVL